jgi:hypothetical protein
MSLFKKGKQEGKRGPVWGLALMGGEDIKGFHTCTYVRKWKNKTC